MKPISAVCFLSAQLILLGQFDREVRYHTFWFILTRQLWYRREKSNLSVSYTTSTFLSGCHDINHITFSFVNSYIHFYPNHSSSTTHCQEMHIVLQPYHWTIAILSTYYFLNTYMSLLSLEFVASCLYHLHSLKSQVQGLFLVHHPRSLTNYILFLFFWKLHHCY